MYRYETHLHTSPVSRCAWAGVRQTLEYYKQLGYAGVFITNHFLDGNINIDRTLPYAERLRFYFSDYEQGLQIGRELALDVFLGVEMSYGGTDFLVYGLPVSWYFDHPEIESMRKSQLLAMLMNEGALVIHAHPFREAGYIDHIRLFPRQVHGVETYNACRTDFENQMAELYCQRYRLLPFAGSDNHTADGQKKLGGMESAAPVRNEQDFVQKVKSGQMMPFRLSR